MENASKALIIAGAILVSIVIITLGVMIVNNVTQTISDNSNLSAQEVASYNAPYESYAGIKSGTQVRSLLQTVKSHNNVQTDETKIIKIIGDGSDSSNEVENEITTDWDSGKLEDALKSTGVKAGYTYDVEMGYDTNSGLIISIAINKR